MNAKKTIQALSLGLTCLSQPTHACSPGDQWCRLQEVEEVEACLTDSTCPQNKAEYLILHSALYTCNSSGSWVHNGSCNVNYYKQDCGC